MSSHIHPLNQPAKTLRDIQDEIENTTEAQINRTDEAMDRAEIYAAEREADRFHFEQAMMDVLPTKERPKLARLAEIMAQRLPV